MKRKLIYTILSMSIAISLVLCGSMVTFAAMSGNGTAADPYLVKTVADLQEIQTTIEGEDAGGSHAKAVYKLSADIADASTFVVSIGTTAKPFQGTFDGDGKTIGKLTKPLFGAINTGASVKDLFLKDCAIESASANVGAVAESAVGASFENIAVTGKVTSTGTGNVGGLFGEAKDGSLKKSYFNGSVVGTTATNKAVVVGNLTGSMTVSDVYYLAISGLEPQKGGVSTGMTSKTAAEFKSGEVCHALQGDQSTLIWGQKLGTDNLPVFAATASPRVWQVEVLDLDNSSKSDMKYVNDGGKITLSAGTGYTVAAYEDKDKKTVFDYANKTITKDMKLYVTATAVTYTVTFNSNGGSSVATQTIATGKTATKPTDPTKSGYTFNGWYKESALTNAWDFSKDTVTANTTLYAKWTASTAAASSNVKTGDEGTPSIFYILLVVGIVGAVTFGGILLYRHIKFY